jgi:hypothetical protein
MHLRLVEITEPEVAEIAALLPAGRLHANGKGLVPYVKGEVYSELLFAALAPLPPQINADPVPQDLPRTWDDLAPDHLVIAKESLELGWWEAVVIERTGDLVTVKYRDYPQYPPLVRHRSVIALIGAAAALRRAFGSFEAEGRTISFKIDHYERPANAPRPIPSV